MRKKRILYTESNRDGTIGGSYYSLFYLIEGLDKKTYEPVVMFFENNPLISKFKKVAEEVIIFDHDSPSSGRVRNFGDFIKFFPRFIRDIVWGHFELTKMIDELKPDIVHLNNSFAVNHDWVLACKRRGIKIVAHDRGARPPASLQTRFFVRFMDAIISVSDAYLKNITDQGLNPKKKYRVHNGLDVEAFKRLSPSAKREQVRTELGVDDDEILVGMVGNIDYWKGQMVLVKSICEVRKRYDSVKVALVGKTVRGGEAYENEIRTYIADHELTGTAFFTGYREDIPALLTAFDIFVHASVEPEPFGRVIIEAMAMKKPIVATDCGGPLEIIEHEKSGILVPMDDSEAMAKAILYFIENRDEADRMALLAQKRFFQHFTGEKMVLGVEKVYREVIGM